MRWVPWIVVLAASCGGDKDSDDVGGDSADTDTDTDIDTDTDADADADADTDTDSDTDTPTGDTAPVMFTLTSPDMQGHATLPCEQQLPLFAQCTGDGGDNLNPQLDWSGVPAGTVSLALVMDDIDFAPGGDPFDHWVVFGIPATAAGIDRHASGTSPTATLPVGAAEPSPYFGSCSSGMNTYRWRLFAFDEALPAAPPGAMAVEAWAAKHALDVATMCHCPTGSCTYY